MFVSIVLNTEYMDIASRSKWYLKNLLHCKENGWILITHEYLWKHFEEIQKDITPRLFNEFEMRPFTADEVSDVEQYFLPDELFERLEKVSGSRTQFLWHMTTSRSEQLETYLQNIIYSIQSKHQNEKIDGIFNCLESWQSIRYISEVNNIPLISYVFSALRKPHGYRQTLYSANRSHLYCSDECEKRWNIFKSENIILPIFSNRELIALLGKERTLHLIPLMNNIPEYELNVCGEGFEILPHIFSRTPYCDEDIYYEAAKYYDWSLIQNRQHPIHMSAMHIGRDEVHNDPAAWILSSKRTIATCSQMVLKAALWDRVPIMPKNTLPFSFMCSKSYQDTQKMPIEFLNYYIFCYLIPNDLMFSGEYWNWRMTNPSETEIYQYHLNFYKERLGLPQAVFEEIDEPSRFKTLLESRGCDEELCNLLLQDIQDFEVDYNTASSRIVANGKEHWRINKIENDVRHFHIELTEPIEFIELYPLDDFAGYAKLLNVMVNGEYVDIAKISNFKFMPKVSGHYLLPIHSHGKSSIDIEWTYLSMKDYAMHTE